MLGLLYLDHHRQIAWLGAWARHRLWPTLTREGLNLNVPTWDALEKSDEKGASFFFWLPSAAVFGVGPIVALVGNATELNDIREIVAFGFGVALTLAFLVRVGQAWLGKMGPKDDSFA
ncbi:MAG TPA: hypothetical protein VLA19_30950 [Herpetosiphonaceae bacterium]|nr:hypothetical protein [Herpetosiphonaceae bacterium]